MAVDKFLELLESELPFLHEIKLDGECRDRVQADIELWKQFPVSEKPCPATTGFLPFRPSGAGLPAKFIADRTNIFQLGLSRQKKHGLEESLQFGG